jgi:tRNA(fMet)-specific endonuclease VapC
VTEPQFLLDSNICIYILADFHGAAAQRLAAQADQSTVTSTIAFAEVERGLVRASAAEREAADALFESVPVLPFDLAAGRAYARLPFRRARFDRLIAAHALSLGLTLVTNNPRDFADVPGLKTENWTL